METVNVDEMQKDLARLLDRVAKGEELIVASAGSPIAKLVPYRRVVGERVPGYWKGKVRISPDFDVLPAEIAAAFRGDKP